MKYESYSPPAVETINVLIGGPIAMSFHSTELTEYLTDDPDELDL